MKRGDLVPVAIGNEFGKPRPALVIQSDQFAQHPTITVLLVTSELQNAPLLRIDIKPDELNGLQKHSQIMIDKTMTTSRERVGLPFGRVDEDTMLRVERSLCVFLGMF